MCLKKIFLKKLNFFFFEKNTSFFEKKPFFDGSDQLTGDEAHSQVMELNVR